MLKLAAPIVTLCLLGAIGLDASDRQVIPEGADAYHKRVAEVIDLIPYRVGDWVGVDKEIRQEALQILDANVSLNRTYRNVDTGETAVLLLVHCADARSLLGHYPPVCYPSQGWNETDRQQRKIECSDLSVLATEYGFAHETLGLSGQIEVAHFAVLPDGRTAPDLDPLDLLAKERRAKFFGGASLQLIVDANLPFERRQEIYRVLLEAASKWIEVVQSGLST